MSVDATLPSDDGNIFAKLLRGEIPDVDLAGQHLAAGLFHQPRGLGEILGGGHRIGDGVGDRLADVDRDDVGALSGQPDGMRTALPTRGPGDQRNAPFQ